LVIFSDRLFLCFALSIRNRNGAPEVDVSRHSTQDPSEENGEMKNQGAYLTRLGVVASFCHAHDCEMMAEGDGVWTVKELSGRQAERLRLAY
jgi:hypothetical protein